VEETLGVVKVDETQGVEISMRNFNAKQPTKLTKLQDVQKILESRKYTYRVALTVTHRGKRTHSVPPSVPSTPSAPGSPAIPSAFASPQLPPDPSFPSDNSDVTDLNNPVQPRKLRVCYVKRVPWQPNAPELFKQAQAPLKKLLEMEKTEIMHQEMVDYWKNLPDWIKYHPSVNVTYHANGEVEDVCINQDWLEKSQMAWWSLPRLKAVLRNGGRFRKNTFRYGFLPALAVVMEKFTRLQAQIKFIEYDEFIVEVNPKHQQYIVEQAVASMTPAATIPNYFEGKTTRQQYQQNQQNQQYQQNRSQYKPSRSQRPYNPQQQQRTYRNASMNYATKAGGRPYRR
jgi:hypothetical protein